MQVDIDITDINAIAYAAQEMAFLRAERARNENNPVACKLALREADQYRRIADQFYSLSRHAQDLGNAV